MAKKKAKPKMKTAPLVRDEAVRIRMTAEYKAWLEEAAAHGRMTVATYLDHAAALAARQLGFPKPPPER